MRLLLWMALGGGALLTATGCSHLSTDTSGKQVLEITADNPVPYKREVVRDTVTAYSKPLDDMPDGVVAMYTRSVGRLDTVFNDSNYVHWAEAEKVGINLLVDTRSCWNLKRPLVKITSCPDFFVEPLTYSRPYLVPEGAAMCHEIGRRFRDSLQARGGGDYRIRISSVLRTPDCVRRLRRVNRNAVDSSVHQMATTVDIPYNSFAADSKAVPRSTADLKSILAEVLLAMRDEGKIWVKYEIKQPCFHITCRATK